MDSSWGSKFLVLLMLVCIGCNDSSDSSELPDLRMYADRFEDEAKKRGYDFDLSNVQLEYVEQIVKNGQTYCGYGYSNYNGFQRVEIAKNCNWINRSDIERENLFFHELGHAFLNRSHDESTLCNGTPLSMMASKTNGWQIYTEQSGDKRDYYISELIDPLVALTQCIHYDKDWSQDSVVLTLTTNDLTWVSYDNNGNYSVSRSQVSPLLSLSATASAPNNGYFFKTINSPNFPEGSTLKYKVRLNSQSLVGNGAAISIRMYENTLGKFGASTDEFTHLTTQDNPANGSLNDYEVELVIPSFSRKTSQLLLFVVLMKETTGTVTFDDIEIVVKPN